MTILELFARLVPWRMQILSPGDGLEGHFRAIFRVVIFEVHNFCRGPPSDLAPKTFSEALVKARRTNFFRSFHLYPSRDQ